MSRTRLQRDQWPWTGSSRSELHCTDGLDEARAVGWRQRVPVVAGMAGQDETRGRRGVLALRAVQVSRDRLAHQRAQCLFVHSLAQ